MQAKYVCLDAFASFLENIMAKLRVYVIHPASILMYIFWFIYIDIIRADGIHDSGHFSLACIMV
jgi:hypothetical protein